MFYKFVSFLAFLLCRFLFRVEVYGRKNIPHQGGFILASNHTSYLDPVVLGGVAPRRISFLAREDLFTFNRAFGWLIRNLDAIPLKREGGDFSAFKKTIQLLRQGKAVVIFPEGGRSLDGKLKAGLPGVGFLAAKSGVPIVPVYIQGSNRALPPKARFFRWAKIKVFFGERINPADITAGLGHRKYETITERTMQSLAQLEERLK